MSLKDVLAILSSASADEAGLAAAERLAKRYGAHLSATFLVPLPDEPLAYEPTAVAGVWAELLGRARAQAESERQEIAARMARAGAEMELRSAEALMRDLGRIAALHARYADLAVVTRPDKDDTGGLRQDVVEGVLFHSGRPVLIVPPGWSAQADIGRRPILAWDASREATRALSEADFFLDSCESVTVVTVDAKPKAWGHGEAPGFNIAAHLARRGVQTSVRNVETSGSVSAREALLAACREVGGDLIIMGAYHSPRLLELVFGGATRDLLASSDVPLLMAH